MLEGGDGLHAAMVEAGGKLCATMLVALASDARALETVRPSEPRPVEQRPCSGSRVPWRACPSEQCLRPRGQVPMR